MGRLRMSTKLALALGSLAATIVVVLVVGVLQMGRIKAKADNILDYSVQEANLIAELRTRLMETTRAEKNAVMAPTDEASVQYAQQTRQLMGVIDSTYADLLKVYNADDHVSEAEKAALAAFVPTWEQFKKGEKEVLDLAVQNTNVKASTLSLNKGEAVWTRLEAALTTAITTANDAYEQAKAANNVAKMARAGKVRQLSREMVVEGFRLLRLQAQHINSTNDAEMQNFDKKLETCLANCNGLLGQLSTLAEGREAETLNAARMQYTELVSITIEIQQLSHLNTNSRSTEMSLKSQHELANQVDAVLVKHLKIMEENAKEDKAECNGIYAHARWLLMAISGISIAVVSLVSTIVIVRITRGLRHVASVLAAGAQQTSAAAAQVAASSQGLAQGASEQAASLEETTSALEEMASMTRKNAGSAQQAATLAGQTKSTADQGNQAMQRMSQAIDEIQKSAAETAKIIKVIDEIAFQTNLLALNAAVEAARAGEAGKGFAVVAEEVRNLAMRSADAAKNTAALIESAVGRARNGVAISAEVEKMLQQIGGAATQVNALIAEIAAASSEQSQGIEQVNTSVRQMDTVTQANAAGAEESAAASEEMASQAARVQEVVQELTQIVNGAAKAAASANDDAEMQEPAPVTRPAAAAIARRKAA